jgi:DNA polymerase family A/3'-5' exonuclease
MSVPFNQILIIDYETRYARKPRDWCPNGYTLSSSTTEEYVRSPLFQDFGASIKEFKPDSAVAQWYRPDELRRVLKTYDWTKTAVVAHNAAFDISILAWHYGIQPAFIFDTLSMSRALRGTRGKNGLAALAADFGLPEKGTAIGLSDGLWELPLGIERQLAEYCNHDVWLCEEVFKRFLLMCRGSADLIAADEAGTDWANFDDAYDMANWVYPIKELRLIDMTLRMFVRPLLELDTEMLGDALEEEKDTREKLLKRLGITDSDLASNDRFAEILRTLGVNPPLKKKNATAKTPNPVGFNFAFAKNDAGFQALMAHEDDNVVSLCEARLKVKSTTERTRAQRFIDISRRGTLPVPLHYYGAITGRWAASKGEAINMQNLKRGSFLRKAIMAPEGYVIVVVDLSQIEPRVLAWLADYDELLEIFRSGQDAYAMFGSQMFNIPGMTRDSHPLLRQSAKSALLGCIAEGQQVLTDFGLVPIEDVKIWHRVWDGLEWVRHEGVVFKGVQDVITYQGLTATQDHVVYTEDGREIPFADAASELAVLATTGAGRRAVRKSQNNKHADTAQERRDSCSVPVHGVRAGTVDKLREPAVWENAGMSALHTDKARTSDPRATRAGGPLRRHPAAVYQPSRRGVQVLRRAGNSTSVFKQARVYRVCAADASAPDLQGRGDRSREKQRPLRTRKFAVSYACTADAQPTRRRANARVWKNDVAYRSRRGSAAEVPRLSVRAALRCKAVARGAEPFANSRALPRDGGAQFSPQRAHARVYDILNAGPRHRFTVSNVLVHNCGYGLGWASFAAQLLVGFLGAPPVRYDKAFAKALGVTPEYIERFLDWDENLKQMGEIQHNCTTQELLVHCVASKKIIDIYRATAAPVKGFWDMCTELIPSALADGQEYNHKGALLFRKEEIVLPNGMSIRYPNLRQEVDKEAAERGVKRKQWVYGDGAETTKLYAGKVTNNVTQALARIVMTDGLLKVSTRIPLVGTVHDEGLGIVKKEEGEKALGWMIRRMTEEPKYMPGIPLAADGGVHKRYGMAKT